MSLLATGSFSFHSKPVLYFPGTVLARCLVFPLIVKGQREAAKIHNHMPEMQKFSARIREAKLAGDQAECELVPGQVWERSEFAFETFHWGKEQVPRTCFPFLGKNRMLNFTDVTLNPVTHFPPITVYKATIEMTRYQKKHDIKLLRPLILPLTQVSRNAPCLFMPNPSSCLLFPMSLDPQKRKWGCCAWLLVTSCWVC